jgi:hypothetical protein
MIVSAGECRCRGVLTCAGVISLKGVGLIDHPLDGDCDGAGEEMDTKQAG